MPGRTPEYQIQSADLLLNGSYERDGFDLIITGSDGTVVVVADYFSFNPPPNLVLANGNGLSPEMVKSLLHDRIETTLFAGPAEGPAALEQIGVVRFASGNVVRKNAEGEEVLQKGDAIFQGDEIVIEGRGYVVATMNDGTRFTQGANSRATLDRFDFDETARTGTFEAKVIQGGFSYKSGKIGTFAGNSRDHTKISTPSAVIRVRGSELDGTVDPATGETVVIHKSGFLTVTDVNDNNPVVLDSPNKSTIIINGGVPSDAGFASPQQIAAVQQALPPQQVMEELEQEDAQQEDEAPEETGDEPPTDAPVDAQEDSGPEQVEAEPQGNPDSEADIDAEAKKEAEGKEGDDSDDEASDSDEKEGGEREGQEQEGQEKEAQEREGDGEKPGQENAEARPEGEGETGSQGGDAEKSAESPEAEAATEGRVEPGSNSEPANEESGARGDAVSNEAGANESSASDAGASEGAPEQRSAPNTAFESNPAADGTATAAPGSSNPSTGANNEQGAGNNPPLSSAEPPSNTPESQDPEPNEPPPDNPPTAVDDVVTIAENLSTEISALVLANDEDPDANQEPSLNSIDVIDTLGTVSLDVANQQLIYAANAEQYESLGVGESATDSFVYTVRSGQFSSSATVQVTIEGQDDPTNARDDVYSVSEGVTLVVSAENGFLANDTDVDTNDTLSVTNARVISDDATEIRFEADGSFEFVTSSSEFLNELEAGETFTSVIEYTVQSSSGATTTATATIEVSGANTAPTVVDEEASLAENETVLLAVLDNDFDSDGDAISIVSAVVTDASGTVSIVDGQLFYEPTTNIAENATLSDEIVYTVTDGVLSTVGRVSLTLTGINDPPVIQPQAPEDIPEVTATAGPVDITSSVLAVIGDDSPGTEVTALDTSGTRGTVILGSVIFDAGDAFDFLNVGESFTDSFGFTATDLQGLDTDGRFSITVLGEADAPTVTGPVLITQTEDDAASVFDLLVGAVDIDTSDVLTVTNLISTGNVSGITVVENDLTLDPNAYTQLSAGETEIVTFSYDVTDTTGLSTPQTATITVTGVNDAPQTSAISINLSQSSPLVTSDFLQGASDAEGDTLSVTTPVLTAGSDVGVSIVDTAIAVTGGSYDFLAAGATQVITYDYTIQDLNGGATANTLTITILGENDAPSSVDGLIAVLEDSTAVINANQFLFSDVDATDTLQTIRIDSLPTTGQLQLSGANVIVGQLISAADLNGSLLTFAPEAQASGSSYASFNFSVSDGTEFSASETLTIDVTAVPDVPTTANTTVIGIEDTITVFSSADFPFSDNDDGDTLQQVRVDTLPSLGTLELSGSPVSVGQSISLADLGSGLLTFTAEPDAEGQGYTSLSFAVGDGSTFSSPSTLTLDLTPVNDSPSSADGTLTAIEDTAIVFTAADFNFVDVDAGDSLQQIRIDSFPSGGILAVNGARLALGQLVSVADINASMLRFTPSENANGLATASFSFSVSDGQTFSASNTLTFDVTPVNDAPTTIDSTITVTEDSTAPLVLTDFSFTDVDAGDSLQQIRIETLPTLGTLELSGGPVASGQVLNTVDISSGLLTFTPDPDGEGAGYTTFSFAVGDGVLFSAPGAITVDVTPVNDSPTAINTTLVAPEDVTTSLTLLDFSFSDVDVGDGLQQVRIDSLPSLGVLELNASPVSIGQVINAADISSALLTFTPDPNANGIAFTSFNYSVSDGALFSPSVTQTIDVSAVNDAPLTGNATVTTAEDTQAVFASADFAFTDVDAGDSLQQIRIETLPAQGAIKLNGAAVSIGQIVSAADINGALLTFSPEPNESGVGYAAFDFSVSDGVDFSSNSTITIDVTPVGDAPTSANTTFSGVEDTTAIFAAADFPFSDGDVGDVLQQVRIETLPVLGSLELGGSPVTIGQVINVGDINGSMLTYDPAADGEGIGYASFDFSVSDGASFSAVNTLTIDIAPINDVPITSNVTITTVEDTPAILAAGDFAFTDVDAGDTLQQVRIETLPGQGSLELNGVAVTMGQVVSIADINSSLLVFTPNPNGAGATYATFNFSVSDGVGFSTISTATIDVTPVNDAPTSSDATVSVIEDMFIPFSAGDFTFTDVDAGDTLQQVRIDTLPVLGVLELNGSPVTLGQLVSVGDINSSLLTYTPDPDGEGAGYTSFDFSVGDGNLFSTSNTITVDVTAVNDPPTTTNVTVTTTEDTPIVFSAGDFAFSDVDAGDTLQQVRIDTIPAQGQLELNGGQTTVGLIVSIADINNGFLVFTPDPEANGAGYAMFDFSVNDGLAFSASSTATIDVTAVNDPPTTSNATVSTGEDTPYIFGVGDFSFNDVDGGSLQQVRVDTLPGQGVLELNGAAVTMGQVITVTDISSSLLTFTSDPDANGVGYASFDFSVSDGTDFSASSTITIDVTPINDAPVATNDSYSITFDTPFTATLGVDDLLLNDNDIDGDTIAINQTPVVDVANGTVVINTDGTFTYTPNNGFGGTDSFTYEINDGNGETDTAIATLNVIGGPITADTSGNFATAANYVGGVVPGPTDDLIVGTGVTLEITAGPVTINSVETDGSGGQLNVTGADLNVTDSITVPVSSGVLITNGTVVAGGLVTIDDILTIDNSNLTAATFTNTGVMTVRGNTSTLTATTGSNDGQIDIEATGSGLTEFVIANSFTNNSTIRLDGAAGLSPHVKLSTPSTLTNAGTIQVLNGDGGGQRTIQAQTLATDTGTIALDTDPVDINATTTQLGAGTVFSGTGDLRFNGAQTLSLVGDFTVGVATAPIDLVGNITISGANTLIVASGAQFALSGNGAAPNTVLSNVNNQGTFVVQENMNTISSATFTNAGVFELRGVDGASQSIVNFTQDFTSTGSFVLDNTSASSKTIQVNFAGQTFTNSGVLSTASSGGGAGIRKLEGLTLDNSAGDILVDAGDTLEIAVTTTQLGTGSQFSGAGTTQFTGTQTIDLVSNFTLSFETGPLDFAGTITISGANTLAIDSAVNLTLTADTISSPIDNQGTIFIKNGTSNISNAGFNNTNGTVAIVGSSSSATLALLASVTNAGIILLDNEVASSRDATLNATGQTITLTAAGSIETADSGVGGGNRSVIADTLDVSLGTLNVAPAAPLTLTNATTTVGSGTTLTGGGVITLTGTQTLNLASDFTITPTSNPVDLSGVITISGPGSLIIDSTAEFTIRTDTIDSNVNNNGTLIVIESTNAINGAIANTGTISLRGTGASSVTLNVANGFANGGTIELDNVFASSPRSAVLNIASGVLTNNNTISTIDSQGGGGTRTISADIVNSSGANIIVDADTTFNSGSFDNQDGTIDVSVGNNVDINSTTTKLGSGTTLTGAGTIELSGTQLVDIVSPFTLLSSAPELVTTGAITFGGAAALTVDTGAVLTLTGDTISTSTTVLGDLVFEGASNQVTSASFTASGGITVQGNFGGSAAVTFANGFGATGAITLDNTFTSSRTATLNVTAGTLNASGTVSVANSGSSGTPGARTIDASILDISDASVILSEAGLVLTLANDTTRLGSGTSVSGGDSINFTGTQTVSLASNFSVTAATTPLDFSGNITIGGVGELGIAAGANLLITGDTIDADVNNQGNLIFEGSGNQVNSTNYVNPGNTNVRGTAGSSAALTFANGFSNAGLIILDNTSGSPRTAALTLGGTLTNTSELRADNTGSGGGLRTITGDIVNTGTLNIDSDTDITGASLDTTTGTIDVLALKTLDVDASVQIGSGTTLAGAGTLNFSSNNPVEFLSAFTLLSTAPEIGTTGSVDFNGPGVLTIGSGATLVLTGDVLNADTVVDGTLSFEQTGNQIGSTALTNNGTISVFGTSGTSASLTFDNGFTNDSLLLLDNVFTSSRNVTVTMAGGGFTNSASGTIQTANTGTGGGLFTFAGDIVNQGSLDIDHTLTVNGVSFDTSTGAVDIANNQDLNIDVTTTTLGTGSMLTGLGFLRLKGTQTVDLASNFTVDGTTVPIEPEGTITFSGAGGLIVDSGGSFRLTADTISSNISNSGEIVIQAGVSTISSTALSSPGTIRIEGTDLSGTAGLTISNVFTNAGTIVLDNLSSNSKIVDFDASAGVTNQGTIQSQNTGTGGGTFTINAEVVNEGALIVDHDLIIDGTTLDNNLGTITVAAGQVLDLNVMNTLITDSATLSGTGTIKFLGTQSIDFGTDFTFSSTTPDLDFSGDITFDGAVNTVSIFNTEEITLSGDTVNTNLEIASGGRLIVQGATDINSTTFTNDAFLDVVATDAQSTVLTIAPSFINDGTITLDNPSANTRSVSLIFTNSFTNNTQLTVKQTGAGISTFNINSSGFVNSNTFNVEADVTVTSSTGSNEAGSVINIDPGKTLDLDIASFTNDGTINVFSASSVLDLSNVTAFDNTNGTISGSGTVNNGAIISGGTVAGTITIAPGNSPGTLTFEGGLNTNIRLEIELEGLNPGTEHDQFIVNGTANLGSSVLDVVLLSGFVPEVGDSFTVFTSQSLEGHFGEVSGLDIFADRVLEVRYQNDDVVLTAVATTQQGSDGADLIVGSAQQDVIVAGASDDVVNAADGADIVFGQAGNDQISVASDFTRVDGGDGVDQLNLDTVTEQDGKRIDNIEVLNISGGTAALSSTSIHEMTPDTNALTGVDHSLVVVGSVTSVVTLVGSFVYQSSQTLDTGSGPTMFDVYLDGEASIFVSQGVLIGHMESQSSTEAGAPIDLSGASLLANSQAPSATDSNKLGALGLEDLFGAAGLNVALSKTMVEGDIFEASDELDDLLSKLPSENGEGSVESGLATGEQLQGFEYVVAPSMNSLQDTLMPLDQYSDV